MRRATSEWVAHGCDLERLLTIEKNRAEGMGKELEATTERLWLEIDSRKVIESDMQNEIMSLRQVAEKAVALVKFWEGAKTSGVTSLPLRDALILACSSLHNVKDPS
jgi:hypothetical protein